MLEIAGFIGVAFIAGVCGWRRKQYLLKCRERSSEYIEGLRIESSSEYEIREKDVIFRLYTKDNPDDPLGARTLEPGSLYDGKIDISKPIKMIIHGWNGNPDSYFPKTIRNAYLTSQHEYNVITVDWSTESHVMYNRDRKFVKELGCIIARFIDRLHEETGFDMKTLHIIGHSLGAHVCGVVGLNTKRKVGRVTGLDPAKPMFSVDDDDRLCPTAAEFVDVIHTCGKALGMYEALGHADFYPNQGTPRQPGCGISAGSQSHERAVEFFAESIHNPKAFMAIKGAKWGDYKRRRSSGTCETSPMGENADHSARGKYWLKTGKTPPYGLGPDS